MDKRAAVDAAKKKVYSILEKQGCSLEQFMLSPAGAEIAKAALASGKLAEKQAAAGPTSLSFIADIAKMLADNSAAGRIAGGAALGATGGYATGNILAKLTSPTNKQVGNLQNRELIAQYDDAIQTLRNRIEAKELSGA